MQTKSMTGNAPTLAVLLLRVFLPFALAYFLSYIFRGVNAVIFPYLERDIGITAADLGLLTSAFFLFFALIQPMLGVALDRYGPWERCITRGVRTTSTDFRQRTRGI